MGTAVPALNIQELNGRIQRWALEQPLAAAAEAALGIPASNTTWQGEGNDHATLSSQTHTVNLGNGDNTVDGADRITIGQVSKYLRVDSGDGDD